MFSISDSSNKDFANNGFGFFLKAMMMIYEKWGG